ncbi:MBG domain-containing protein [Mucilaginibacter lappiensis]|uniref:MBG domain-containing protein n=1 Tax=Mucilaginibacter lappiensis TaxID=354630 RepID=UPI003D1FC35A
MNEFLHLSKRIFFFLFVSVMCSLQFANAQTTLTPGDIAVIGFNITNGQFAFVTLTDISANTVVNFTDRGWTGSGFNNLATEGTITWTASAAVSAGTVVNVSISAGPNPTITGFPNGSTSISGWTSASIFANNGDQTIVYQGSDASPTFVYGFSCSTSNGSPSTTLDWQTTAVTTNRDSQLPSGLTNSNNSNAATAIAFCGQNVNHNYVYNAKSHGFAGTRTAILSLIADRANWVQSPSAQDLSLNGANFPASFTLGAVITAPTTQASNVTFASTTTTSFTASWTNGNGSSRAVFIKAASSGSPSPANNTTYTGNAAFGSGTQIGATGWYCVYNGTGTFVPVTGLTGATAYQVMVVEYNGTSGSEKYQTSTAAGNPANVTTLTPNTPPVVTASGGSTTFTGPSAVAVDNGITVSDIDNATLASATVTITGNFQSAEDLLAFTPGGTGNIAGSFNTTTGVFALTSAGATATTGQWQAALRAVTYQNTAASPNTATRTVTFVVNDSNINSTPATKNITIAVPVISTTGTLSALTTTYGTASSAGTFNVSGVNMAAGILVTAPTGFEVSTDNITFTNTVTVGLSGNIASTQVRIRLASGINAGNYSGNVVLSSTGATSVNVATVASTVNKAPLTITANSDTKVYGAPVPALTVSYSGFVGTDNALGLTTQPTITTTAVANSPVNTYPITASGAVSSNYTFIYQPGTLTITPAALTITADNKGKPFGQALTGGAGSTAFTSTGLVDSETIGSVTITYGTGSAAAAPVNTYTGSVVASAATGGTFNPANYTITYVAGNLTVGQAILTITANNATKTYGAAVPVLSVSYSGFVGTDDASSLTTQPTISTTAVTNSPVNTYPITASGAVSSNYTIVYNPGTLTVTPAALTITANNATKTYGSINPTLSVSYSGFVGTDNAASLTTGPTVNTTAITGSPVNTYPITASGAVSTNYAITYIPGTLTITPAVLTITANNATKTYGAAVPVLSVNYSGFVGTDNASSLTTAPTISTTVVTNSPVNTYPITASGAASANYTFVYNPGTLTVTPKALTITANNKTKPFGQALTGGSGSTAFTSAGLINTETIGSVTIAYGAGSAAGAAVNTYTGSVVASAATGGTFTPGNYNITYVAGDLVVGKAVLTITANNATKTYGSANPVLSVSYSGFTGTDDASSLTTQPTISTTAVTSSPVNTYPITASGAVSANYTIVYSPGILTVTPATLTVTANNATKTYGSVNPALSISYSGFVGTDDASSLTTAPTVSTTAVTNSPVNTYPITATGAASVNYTFIYNPGTLTVSKAALTITANSKTKPYGQALTGGAGSTAFTSTGLVNSETIGSVSIAYGTGAAAGAAVNTYTGSVTASAATGGTFNPANYTITYVAGDIVVSKAALTITADNKGKPFGQALTGGAGSTAFTSTGLVNSETIGSVTITYGAGAAAGAPVNTYTGSVVASAATGGTFNAGNYTITYVAGNLTVGQAILTITANNATKTYGAAVPVLSVSYSGFVGTDDASSLTTQPTISTTAVTNSPVNTYPITASGAVSSNYTIVYNPGTLTVTPAALTITANNATKTYGSVNPTLSVSYSGFVGTDNVSSLTTAPTVTTTAVTGSPVNTYPITASGAASANYSFIYKPGTLTVTPAALTITANNTTKTYGSVNPALSVSYSGFVGTDNAASLTTGSTVSTTAVTNSPVNTYPITASGAVSANYTFIYKPGTLTITPAALTIMANNATKTYGAAVPVLGVSYSGFVGTDNVSSLTTQPTVSTTAVTNSPVNTYPITASGAVSANYTFIYNPGTLTVTPAVLTITANNATKTYGAAVPVLSVSYSGFVGTDNASSLTTAPTVSTTVVTNSPVNTYPITASGAASVNYTFIYKPGILTVTPAILTITANNKMKPYGQAITGGAGSTGFTSTGLVNSETIGSVTITYGTGSAAGAAVNTYTGSVVASAATGGTFTSGNYTITYVAGDIIVGKKVLTITANNATKTYGSANPVLSVSYSGFTGTDNASSLTTVPTVSTTAVTNSPVNTYPITASGAVSANYTFIYKPGILTVTPASLTITASNKTKSYGQALTGGAGSTAFTSTGLVNSETIGTVTIAYGTGSAAGATVNTYTGSVVASAATGGTFAPGNYNITYVAGDIIVGKVAVAIAANAKIKTYGDADPALTYSITGGALVGADAFTGTLSRDAGEDVGAYAIKQGSLALNGNYTLTYTGANLTISKKAITVTANPQTKPYGGSDPALTYSITSGALVGTDAFTGALIRDAGESAGIYAIKQGNLALSNNYTLTYTGANLTITQKMLTITANNATKTYGSANPALSVSYSGFVGTDNASSLTTAPTVSTTAVTNSPVNTYPITASGAASSNYTIVYKPGVLTVTSAALTITANNATKTYGSVNPALSVSYSGFVGTDNASSLTTAPTVSTTAIPNSPVNTYPITASGAVSSNYTIVYKPGVLTVTSAALTITANNAAKTYGSANPALSVSYSGFVGTDNASSLTTAPTVSTTAITNSPVNTYPITASGAVSTNYTIVYKPGVLTITTAALTITANNKNKPYGQTITGGAGSAAFTSTGLVNSETIGSVTIAYGTGAAANAAVNTYTGSVVASAATGGTFTPGNYHITYVAGNIVVSRATLTITANNQSKIYGAANPALSVSYSGFVNGDNSASLTTKPAVVTTATVTSAAGTYPITASGAAIANYNIVYAPGTLTINKAMLTITADNKSRLYGTPNPVLTATYSGFVNGDNQAGLITQPILKTVATINSAPGNYPVTASGAVSPNYSFNYVSGKLTVRPLSNANLINLTLSSGTLLPAFTPGNFAYTTQVDNDVERIRLTLTFDATATARVNGTLTPNDRPSYSIPLDEGNNTITIVVTAQDGTTTNTYTVLIYRGADQKNLVVTNILTPNGDGKNDVWLIQDIQLYPNNIVTVYDRGGRTVYTKHGYTNDWNGTYGGSPLTEGTYYYIVDLGPQQRKFKGYITIVRNR